jgi:hypothetical protein
MIDKRNTERESRSVQEEENVAKIFRLVLARTGARDRICDGRAPVTQRLATEASSHLRENPKDDDPGPTAA